MPETKRPLKVFLCHAHADRDAVRALYTRLKREGVDVWLDKEKLLPGADWELEIRKAVRDADVVVVCLSKQFNQAGFRQKEVRIALDTAMEQPEGEIFIIPARLEECETLESLRKWHWVDLFKSDGFQRLIMALRIRADSIGATLRIRRGRATSNELETKVKAEQEAVQKTTQKARLEDEEQARQKAAKEKAAHDKARLEEEQERQRVAREKEEQDAIEKAAIEKYEKELQREFQETIRKAKRDLRWEKFKINFRYRLQLAWIYRIPILILIVSLAIIVPLSIDLSNKIPELTRALNITSTATNTFTTPLVDSSKTIEPNQAPIEVFIPTAIPTEITDAKGTSMVLVPAGEFMMGSDVSEEDEKPAHTVFLDSYYIDKYEVTNALYKLCVDAGVCQEPKSTFSSLRESYYGNSQYDDYPVVFIDWDRANTYCLWRDARLPTEAEWEKAARGSEEKVYPWGNEVDCNRANYYDGKKYCVGDTTRVGSYENGKSEYGIYDMAGNVREWVSSLYIPYPYKQVTHESLSVHGDIQHIMRGGTWGDNAVNIQSTHRYEFIANNPTYINTGFRCASSVLLQPILNETPIPQPEAISSQVEITDGKGLKMILVPAGNFIAGGKDSEENIYLDTFYIDKYEVTNLEYSKCVSSGDCKPPASTILATYDYYGNSQYENYPVVWVNYEMAQTFCEWREARLPTTSEWEKAARGAEGRIYPWGNILTDEPLANSYGSKDEYEITSPVGSFPDGVSPYGAYDMVGNVWEWNGEISYSGGSWVYGDLFVYNHLFPVSGGARFDVGFRCAKDAP